MYAQYRTVILSSLATVLGAVLLLSWVGFAAADKAAVLENFEECAAAGNPIMESYPRRCRSANLTFTEDIGNALEMANEIRVSIPRPNQGVYTPIIIKGEARADWFASGTFPIVLLDSTGRQVASATAVAEDGASGFGFIDFDAQMEVSAQKVDRAVLVFKKVMPVGSTEDEIALTLPIRLLGPAAPGDLESTTRVFPREISLRPGDVVEFSDGLFVRFSGISESFCTLADVRCRWAEGRFAELELTDGALGQGITDIRLELRHHPVAALNGYDFELLEFSDEEIVLKVPSSLNAVISRYALASSE